MILNLKYITILADNAKKNKKYMKHLKSFRIFESASTEIESVLDSLNQSLQKKNNLFSSIEIDMDSATDEGFVVKAYYNNETVELKCEIDKMTDNKGKDQKIVRIQGDSKKWSFTQERIHHFADYILVQLVQTIA
jgi:hypothetical protein